MRFSKFFLTLGFILLFVCSTARAQVLAKINNKEITLEEFERRYEQNAKLLPGQIPSKEEVLKNVIYFELALQEAARLGLDKDNDLREQFNILLYQALIKKQVQPQVDALNITEEEVRKYYQENPLIRTNHIVFLSRPDMSERELKDLRTRAEKVLAQAKGANRKAFEELARKHSEGPSARMGGDTDWGARHKLLPEYYDAALRLKNIGDVSDLVETPYGLHIIQLTGRRAYKDIDQNYRNFIIQTLRERKGQEVFNKYFEGLRAKAKVTVNEKLLQK